SENVNKDPLSVSSSQQWRVRNPVADGPVTDPQKKVGYLASCSARIWHRMCACRAAVQAGRGPGPAVRSSRTWRFSVASPDDDDRAIVDLSWETLPAEIVGHERQWGALACSSEDLAGSNLSLPRTRGFSGSFSLWQSSLFKR